MGAEAPTTPILTGVLNSQYYLQLSFPEKATKKKVAKKTTKKTASEKVNTVKEKTDLPVAVGFGISRPSHIEELKKFADGAVIGSAIIDVIMESKKNDSVDRVVDFISKLSK